MSKPTANAEMAIAREPGHLWARPAYSLMVGGAIALIGAVVLFYAEQNWSGKRAWERCKQGLAAQGAVMAAVHSTTAIPDNLNVFKAPRMSEWFLGQAPNELTSNLSAASWNACDNTELMEITVVSRTNQSASPGLDLSLDYDPPLLGLSDQTEIEIVAPEPPQIIPLIVMDSVPLTDAIRNLALQEGRKYQLDSNIVSSWTQTAPGPGSDALHRFLNCFPGRQRFEEPHVTIRWANVTAFQALLALLENYNLVWTEDPTNHAGRISIKSETTSIVQLSAAARAQLKQIMGRVSSLTGPDVHVLKGSMGFSLYHRDGPSVDVPVKPARITIRSWCVPTAREVQFFLPGPLPRSRASRIQIVPSGTNIFRVLADPPCFCSAEAYLAQTDCYQPKFDLIREALKRPYARLDPDDSRTHLAQPRNYVNVRIVSQTLAQRAQAYLLVGQPEQALRDLTLLHDLSAVVEADQPNLVAAMIEVAITGLYVEVIHDGFRLGAWREPELIALQGQLEKKHLGPLLVEGLSSERLDICRTIETASASEFASKIDPPTGQRNLWEKLASPGFFVLTFGPRGWRYQSMVASATLLQRNISCFDRVTQILRPDETEEADRALEAFRKSGSPRTSLAGIATPNFVRAWQTVSRIQTHLDHAFIACALERFRLTHGDYPPDLASLVPGFAERLPQGILGRNQFRYRRLDNSHFTLFSLGWHGSVPAIENWVWN